MPATERVVEDCELDITAALGDCVVMDEAQIVRVLRHTLRAVAGWVDTLSPDVAEDFRAAVAPGVVDVERWGSASYTLDFTEAPRLTMRHANDPTWAGEPSPGGRVVFPGLADIDLD